MQSKKLSLDAAFEFVKSRRNVISPNMSFMQQLLDFEKSIQLKCTPPQSPCRLMTNATPGFSFFGQEDIPSPYISQPHSPMNVLQSPAPVFSLTWQELSPTHVQDWFLVLDWFLDGPLVHVKTFVHDALCQALIAIGVPKRISIECKKFIAKSLQMDPRTDIYTTGVQCCIA